MKKRAQDCINKVLWAVILIVLVYALLVALNKPLPLTGDQALEPEPSFVALEQAQPKTVSTPHLHFRA